MNEPILLVRVAIGEAGGIQVLSPGVGWWSEHPQPGALLGPGSRVGLLTVLNHRFALILPDGALGATTGSLPRDLAVPVEHGQVLFELAPLQAGDGIDSPARGSTFGSPSGTDIPEGTYAVVSPTDGIFYRRPSPDAAPFVAVGDRIRTGQPVGLVEIMKTFNQIQYGAPGLPAEAEVVDIRADDSDEIHAGQILVVVRPTQPR